VSTTTVPDLTSAPVEVGDPAGDEDATTPGAGDVTTPLTRTLPVALPVAIEVRGPLLDPLRRTAEGVLGWQVVDEVTASLVPPAVRLVDTTGVRRDGTPIVLLCTADDDPVAAAEATARLGPDAVVRWPATDAALSVAVGRAAATPRATAPSAATVRVGGAGGGVGTTTIALTLAGIAAWRGATVLVASGDGVLLPTGAPAVDPGALTAPDLFVRAAAIRGVVGARAVRTTAPVLDVGVSDPTVGVAVLDVGVADEVDVLVLRPDATGLAALERTAAAAVVVTGTGPVPGHVLTAAIGRRRRVDAPWSHRVARAGLVGRVPAALPGRFVRSLAGLVPDVGGRRRTHGPDG
jgi:hypothetical protein